MMQKRIVALLVLMTNLAVFGQADITQKLRQVMENYEALKQYKIEIYTQIHYASGGASEKLQKAGEVVRKGNKMYMKNDQKEVFQSNGKRVEVDNNSKVVVYYPAIENSASLLPSYEPDWKLLDQKKVEIKVTKKNGKTTFRIPVNEFYIQSVEYTIGSDNLLHEMVYHYHTTNDGEIDRIRVVYKNDLASTPPETVFSFQQILHFQNDGTPILTKRYNNFQFINTSSYETQN